MEEAKLSTQLAKHSDTDSDKEDTVNSDMRHAMLKFVKEEQDSIEDSDETDYGLTDLKA